MGFVVILLYNVVCVRLGEVVIDLLFEIIEYLKCDIVNIVLCNKDNYVCNIVIWCDVQGWIGLMLLFDFVLMWLYLDGIVWCMCWECDDGGLLQWVSVIVQVCEVVQIEQELVRLVVCEMVLLLVDLLLYGCSFGIESIFLNLLVVIVDQVWVQLEVF